MKTLKNAADELQAIRNELAGGHGDVRTLLGRCDAAGSWVAAKGKPYGLSAKLLREANEMHDRLQGGTGRMGNRLQIG